MPETTRRHDESTRAKTQGEEAPRPDEAQSSAPAQEVEQAELGAELEEEVGAIVAIAMMDAEAAAAYGVAADVVDDDGIRETLLSFQRDHLRHVDDLNGIITEHGGKAVPSEPPAGASLMVTLAQSMGALGTDEAILALVGNEQLTNSVYATALELGLGEKTTAVLERNKADEERHLEALDELSSEVEEEVDDEVDEDVEEPS